ncbi:MAG: helix-turn-helix domain-containing protein [Chloroflexi bacterium]|nr:helix-turn-helix domain-containing protein [Chloroflexota bacterium]MBI3040612.1 helix-turn-helix domain-containing protein [Chloroflexota bacterium]MBI3930728.1 helix-turn-helix domain-containing protein [Chloroflexota bacterium]
MTQQSLVTISEASHVLGVSEAALRQWTDEGKIKAFITPGGHRRYSRTELKKFMTSNRKTLGIKDLAAELEDTVQLHREIAKTHLHTTSCYGRLNQESQERLARLGQRLLHLIIRYITEPSKREETLKLACNVGHNHGQTLVKMGFPLTDSVEAFILHRNPIMNAAIDLIKKSETLNTRVVEAIPLVDHLMDEVLVALVAAHQLYKDETRDQAKGRAGE